jgi:DNA helicase HerA-like ATPase
MLSELFENLPEVGDPDKPKLVFFFDEAHLLFADIPKVLEDKIEQVVRLIRSKGVGIYFVTQNPLDLPETVLGQLGNRVQHALRAFTPKEQKAVKVAAETFRPNPKLNTAQVIMELAVGEALISMLDAKGSPTIVERALVCPPCSRMTPLTGPERSDVITKSILAGHYEKAVDRESAYEQLKVKIEQKQQESQPAAQDAYVDGGKKLLAAAAKSAAHAIGSQIGRQIIRGVLGSIFGGRR